MESWIQIVGLLVVVSTIFKILDWFISKETDLILKDKVVILWISLDEFTYNEAIHRSLIYCNGLFNKIYGQRHFTWRCFLVSSLISILSTLSFLLLFSSLSDLRFLKFILDFRMVVVFALLINTWADFFSLVETRWVLHYAENARFRCLSLLLLLDLVATSSIYVVSLWLCVYLPAAFTGLQVKPFGAVEFFWSNLTCPLDNPGASALIWSTFTTSILFYLYCSFVLTIKFLGLTKTPLGHFLQNLEEEDRLLTAIGIFLGFLIACLLAVLKFIKFILAN